VSPVCQICCPNDTWIGEHTQAGRWIKFTSLREITAVRSTLEDYLYEAIDLEESGTKIDLKNLPSTQFLRSCSGGWTTTRFSGRHSQRSHQAGGKSDIFHVSSAKQAKTRAARAEKCLPMILSGRGFNELPN
jgi:uncharacterized protein YdeI (YjbR/CyaY-like superfamily)